VKVTLPTTAFGSVRPFLQGLTITTETKTDHATPPVAIDRICAMRVMRPYNDLERADKQVVPKDLTTWNESVPKMIISDTINLPLKTAISIAVISNHNSFRVLSDKIASVYLFEKYIYILAMEIASPANLHCANCIGTLSFPTIRPRRMHRVQRCGLMLQT